MDVGAILLAQDTGRFWLSAGFAVAMFVTALFLIMLVLVQRGRGGGLAGAFGGMGGQSAFGAKAGDTFTKITIYASTFWILLCIAALVVLNPPPSSDAAPPDGISAPGTGDETTSTNEGETVEGEESGASGAGDADADNAGNGTTGGDEDSSDSNDNS